MGQARGLRASKRRHRADQSQSIDDTIVQWFHVRASASVRLFRSKRVERHVCDPTNAAGRSRHLSICSCHRSLARTPCRGTPRNDGGRIDGRRNLFFCHAKSTRCALLQYAARFRLNISMRPPAETGDRGKSDEGLTKYIRLKGGRQGDPQSAGYSRRL